MKSNSLNIDLEVYTGPFDVLLRLIEKQKVDIYDIKIEDITSPYMEAINEMDIPLGQLSEFIYISSILLYIKSSKLMPKDKNDTVEEDFISYLIEYKKIKSGIPQYTEYVIFVQTVLKKLGMYDGKITGIYDIETINRVKEYRRIKEIKETDFITDTLLEALYFDLEQVTDHQMAKVEEIVMGCEK